jgi:type VI secretion system protein ImpJ
MRQLQPVLWTKGTLLTPQHLQTQDRFFEDSLRFVFDSLSYCPWGFQELQIDREALGGGLFTISSASGIFPDGLLFDVPDADPAPPAKPLLDQFDTLEVFLAVPSYRDRGTNVSLSGALSDARYVADKEDVRDELRPADEKPIQVARKGLRLITDAESRQGYSTLPVARIKRSAAGIFRLDDEFIPPLLDFSASERLVTIARRLLEILTAKSTELASARREKNQSLADFTSSEIASFWMLYTINTFFPRFRHLFEVSPSATNPKKRAHPEDLYSAMTSLAAALTTFDPEIHPRDLPVYEHGDLSRCFTELDAKLRLLLDRVLPKNYVTLRMAEVRPSIFATSLEKDSYFDATSFNLAIQADMDRGELIREAPRLIKVCSAADIDHRVRNALPALELRHVSRPPAALPIKTKYEYFSLSKSGDVWEAITRARNIAAYVPAKFSGAEIELIILLPKAL